MTRAVSTGSGARRARETASGPWFRGRGVLRLNRGPSCSPRRPRTVCSYKLDLPRAMGPTNGNANPRVCRNHQTFGVAPPREGWKNLYATASSSHPRARGASALDARVLETEARVFTSRLIARERARARRRPVRASGSFSSPLGRDDAVDVLPVGASDVQRVRHLERAAVPGEVRPGPVQPDERIRQLHESARAAHSLITATQYMRGASDPPPPPPRFRLNREIPPPVSPGRLPLFSRAQSPWSCSTSS